MRTLLLNLSKTLARFDVDHTLEAPDEETSIVVTAADQKALREAVASIDAALANMPEVKRVISAAADMDWQQVVLNGGPPCFYLEENGTFCGRAYRWEGHADKIDYPYHPYVPLHLLIHSVTNL